MLLILLVRGKMASARSLTASDSQRYSEPFALGGFQSSESLLILLGSGARQGCFSVQPQACPTPGLQWALDHPLPLGPGNSPGPLIHLSEPLFCARKHSRH